MVQTYNELKVTYHKDKITSKSLTKRGQVRISEQTANTNNTYSKSTGLLYELSKKQPKAVKPKVEKPEVEEPKPEEPKK